MLRDDPTGRFRMLVVDDDPVARRAVQRGLEARGIDVSGSASGEDALRMQAAERFDGIVCDIFLTNLDGVGVVRRLRESGDATPVVLLSGVPNCQRPVAGIQAGACCFMTKPADIDLILEAFGLA